MRKFALLVGLFTLLGSTALQAATPNVIGGELVGASDVDVGGVLYDVAFVDGTCIQVFNGCSHPSDFTFDFTSAIAAAHALLDQVFLDGPTPPEYFDTVPSLTYGCNDPAFCSAYTPYDAYSDAWFTLGIVRVADATNHFDGGMGLDYVETDQLIAPHTFPLLTAGYDKAVFAVWELSSCTGNDATGDTDNDGTCNDSDTDDDGDGYSDAEEVAAGSDPLDPNSTPANAELPSLSPIPFAALAALLLTLGLSALGMRRRHR